MMESQEVLAIADRLEGAGIAFWLDGGWGVDALVGERTRPHDDLDLVIELRVSDRVMQLLGGSGYSVIEDERPTRFVVRDSAHRRVDFHTVSFDEDGGGIQVLQDDRTYRYPPEGFTGTGSIDGRPLPCLTAEVQAECHIGYEPDRNDFHDMRLLRDRFGLDVPAPFDRVVSREELLEKVREAARRPRETVLVAIGGWGGSGKSTLARWLAERLDATLVCSDDFGRPGMPGWEWERFREQVLSPLVGGRPARYQRYDWDQDRPAEWHDIEPGGLVIAEGVSITRTELGDPWDLTVWVECPYDIRLARGVERDGEAMRGTWVDVWMPEEAQYVEEQRPRERADYVVLGYD